MKLLPILAVAAVIVGRLPIANSQETSVQSAQDGKVAKPAANQSDADRYKFTARSNLVFLPTRVQNKKGETIYGLRPEQFSVEDNGAPQAVRIEEDPDTLGLSLVVVIQCSRSADKEFNKFKGLSAMIDGIVGDAPHEVAIISYGEEIYKLGDFSNNADAVSLAVSKLKDCGDYSAVTIDAVDYAIGMLSRRQNRFRHAILLISEGRDHGSRSKLPEVVAELGITDTVIFTVAFAPAKDEFIRTFRYGDPDAQPPTGAPNLSSPNSTPEKDSSSENSSQPPDPTPVYTVHPPPLLLPPEFTMVMNALRRSTAKAFADLSGGEYIQFTTRKGFDDGLARISNQIHNYYLLSFTPPSTPAFGLHTLRVRVPDYPDAIIQTRKSYWSGILEPASGAGSQTK